MGKCTQPLAQTVTNKHNTYTPDLDPANGLDRVMVAEKTLICIERSPQSASSSEPEKTFAEN